jgi:hypothetical protein
MTARKCHTTGVEGTLVMGFPPRHRFPPKEPEAPALPPVTGASLMPMCTLARMAA